MDHVAGRVADCLVRTDGVRVAGVSLIVLCQADA